MYVCLCSVCSAVSRGAFALLTETSSRTADAVASFSRTLAVPVVTPSSPVDTPPVIVRRHPGSNDAASVRAPVDAASYVVFMRPPYHRALADVIQLYNWPRVFYVYDNSEGAKDYSLPRRQAETFCFRSHVFICLFVCYDDYCSVTMFVAIVTLLNKNLAIANRSRVSCAHNTSRASIVNCDLEI